MDWIEQWFALNPDGGDGSIEAAMGNLKAASDDAEKVRAHWLSNPFQTMLLASLYSSIGRKKEAVAFLNEGFKRGDSTVLTAAVNPYFDTLKNYPEYRRFLARIGWQE